MIQGAKNREQGSHSQKADQAGLAVATQNVNQREVDTL